MLLHDQGQLTHLGVASPQKNWKYGFSTHLSHSSSSDRSKVNFKICKPAVKRVGSGGWSPLILGSSL